MADDASGVLASPDRLRIAIDELPARTPPRSGEAIEPSLERLGAAEGAPCQLSCDCRIGLICVEGICSEKD